MNATKQIVKIQSELEMLGFLKSNTTQCRFVSLLSDTPVVKIRKGNPFPGLRKVSRKSGLINANYNTSVRRRIAETLGVELAETVYENGEVWYKHLTTEDGKALPVVVNKNKDNGEHYLQFFTQKAESQYVMPDGTVVASEQVKPYLYKESERPDWKPTVIAVNLCNVKELRASGVIMQAEDVAEAEAALAAS
jgi:hypothetical protein